jgi:hypothetical protein
VYSTLRNKLVVLAAEPQIGKTSSILALLGIMNVSISPDSIHVDYNAVRSAMVYLKL